MNDPTRFGMAKTVMTIGQKAGFDMSDHDQLNEFMRSYNEQIRSGQINTPFGNALSVPGFSKPKKTKAKKKQKQKRKIAKKRR